MEPSEDIRQIAHQVINRLPAGASWDDVLYRLVERREIDLGLADSAAGRTASVESVMEAFDIKP